MNYKMVFYILGLILKVESALLTLPVIIGALYREKAAFAYLVAAALCCAVGFALSHIRVGDHQVFAKEGFAAVGLAWTGISLFGAVPFVICGDIPNYIDALFETVSGFTTTGSSILSTVEDLNHCSLFWRSFTHWVGGMGIIVFVLAIVPFFGGTTLNLMKAESPGPVVGKLVPRIRQSAAILYRIYLIFTAAEIILLWAFGMPLFEAVCHTFGTVGTGGFGVRNDSYAGYAPPLQIITIVFMIMCGVNFNFYYFLTIRKVKNAFRMAEVRVYLIIIAAATAVITWNTSGLYKSLSEGLRHAAFQVATIITTTGYATTDFNRWPEMSKVILIILMMVGACAGSTGGGMKVSRVIILAKTIRKEIDTILHPRLVKKIQMDGAPIAHETVRSTNVFIAVYFMIFFASVLLISIDEFDFTTNFTAVAATLNNIGPGMAVVGPTGNYALFSPFSKLILIFDMLAGRLEIFPMLLLFSMKSWRRYN